MDDLGLSDGEDINNLTVNKDFAKSYDQYRRKEEIQKLKDKGVEDYSDIESSSDESELEYASKIKGSFLNLIADVKANDPIVYDKNRQFYPEPTSTEGKKKKPKKQLLKDYERERLLQGHQDDDDEFDINQPQPKSYYKELEEAKAEFSLQANQEIEGDSDGELFTTSEVKKCEKEKLDENVKDTLKPYWTDDSKLSYEDKFLRDYILNEQWRTTGGEIDTEDEEKWDEDDVLMEQREALDYNINNPSEAKEELVRSYPRKIQESVRNFETKKQKRRAEKRKRKEEKQLKRSEEIKRYKALQREQLVEDIAKYQKKGLTDLTEEDACDFDPETFDEKQNKRFENYYNEEFNGEDIEKPVWSDDDDDEPDWDKWNGNEYDNEDFAMDCEYEENVAVSKEQKKMMEQQELSRMMGKRRKRRKKSAFHQAIEADKPVFDPEQFDYGEFLDKYYEMDCADMIGEDKIKFKYRQVEPQTYGLTPNEILNSDNKALNSWVSIKKVVGRHPQARENKIRELYEKKLAKKDFHFSKFNDMHRRQTGKVSDEENDSADKIKVKKEEDVAGSSGVTSKKKKKKTKVKRKSEGDTGPKKKKKKTKVSVKEEPKEKKTSGKDAGISKSRLAAYGI